MIAVGDVILDVESRTVQCTSSAMIAPLTPQQTVILDCLLSRAGRTVSNEGLARVVWATRGRPDSWIQALRVQIYNVRAAARSIGLPRLIQTKGQSGWCIDGTHHVVRLYTPEQAAIADAAVAAVTGTLQ